MGDLETCISLAKIAMKPPRREIWDLFLEAIDEPEYPPFLWETQPAPTPAFGRVVMVTGGLDSTIAYHLTREQHRGDPVTGLYLDFGQPYAGRELDVIQRLGIPVVVEKIDIGYHPQRSQWKHIIPGRNLIAMIRAAQLAGAGGSITFGATFGEIPARGGDKSARFLAMMTSYLYEQYAVALETWMKNKTKNEWAKHWVETGHPRQILLDTYSCFAGEDHKHCGRCQACLRRYIALRYGGFTDGEILTSYQLNPMVAAKEAIQKYRILFMAEILRPGITGYGRRAFQDLTILAPELLQEYGRESRG